MAWVGKTIAPPRFLLFIALLGLAVPAAGVVLDDWWLAGMAGFDAAALAFLLSCVNLLWTEDGAAIRQHARENDARRTVLLVITGLVMLVVLVAVAAVTIDERQTAPVKVLVIATLAIAWLFSNTIYALHYAHLAYREGRERGCGGLDFPGTSEPLYGDFVYFAFTLGMTFQTSDVTISDPAIRRAVILHCLAAFTFNIGVLAFTINVLGG